MLAVCYASQAGVRVRGARVARSQLAATACHGQGMRACAAALQLVQRLASHRTGPSSAKRLSAVTLEADKGPSGLAGQLAGSEAGAAIHGLLLTAQIEDASLKAEIVDATRGASAQRHVAGWPAGHAMDGNVAFAPR